jgi:hypothetical protein
MVDGGNFFGGDLGDYNQHYGEDELDRLHGTGDKWICLLQARVITELHR